MFSSIRTILPFSTVLRLSRYTACHPDVYSGVRLPTWPEQLPTTYDVLLLWSPVKSTLVSGRLSIVFGLARVAQSKKPPALAEG